TITALLLVVSTVPAWSLPLVAVYVSAGSNVNCVENCGGVNNLNLGSSHHPADLVYGPDGLLYIADTDDILGGLIERFDPQAGANPQIVADISGSPQGLAFAGNSDLYVSTSTAVFVVPNAVRALGANQTITPNPAFALSNGAGIAFGKKGTLWVVQNANNGG